MESLKIVMSKREISHTFFLAIWNLADLNQPAPSKFQIFMQIHMGPSKTAPSNIKVA
jgi:hypothetical protein